MARKITDYKIIFFYILVWAISGLLFLPNYFGLTKISFVQLAPGLSAILLCWSLQDFSYSKKLIKDNIIKEFKVFWFLFSLIAPVIISIVSAFISWVFQGNSAIRYESISVFQIILIVVFALTEEIGWRSFLLPLLLRKYNIILASIILGILWGLWHLPVYMGENIRIFILFIFRIIPITILISYIFLKSNGSLLMVTLFHVSNNVVISVLPYTYNIFSNYIIVVITWAAAILTTLFLLKNMKSDKSFDGKFR